MARRHCRFVRLADHVKLRSAAEASHLIVSGRVTVNGLPVTNANTLVAIDAVVTVVTGRTLRGTVKLRRALSGFGLTASGRVCVDAGAAAGGFTAALLEAGARRVYAVDVGFGQLAGWLGQDRRVINLERTNVANLGPGLVPEPVDIVCLDLSYLALADAIPQLTLLSMTERARLIALVKPAFELHAGSAVGGSGCRR